MEDGSASLLPFTHSDAEMPRSRAGRATEVSTMSTDMSVPHPRISGLYASDSALFATLLREAPIGFALFDTDLRFKRANETLARLHGVTAADLDGKRPAEAIPGDLGELIETA